MNIKLLKTLHYTIHIFEIFRSYVCVFKLNIEIKTNKVSEAGNIAVFF